ncbi:MAG: type II toxin-antitoxin system VapB family antitoxin [Terracidiphilus sp.]
MSLNIKNAETEQLARKLARQNNETMTTAITVAIKERLERQERNANQGLAAWLEEISRETALLMDDGRSSKELMDALYDEETGLPK